MLGSQTADSRETIFEIVGGVALQQALRCAIQLDIPERLESGALPIGELAEAVGARPEPLYRMMRLLANKGVFDEMPGRVFGQNGASRLLLAESPCSMRKLAVADVLGGFMVKTLRELGHTVRTGEPAFNRAHDGMEVWEYFSQVDPAAGREMAEGAASLSAVYDDAIVANIDASGFTSLTDVGGGDGTLLRQVLRANSHLCGTLYDQPHVIEMVRASAAPDVVDRLGYESGSFLDMVPPGSEAYMMRHVLHDWDDDNCVRILSNCRMAAPNATLMIIERVLHASGNNPYTLILDLWMMMLFKDAKERTEEEYVALLERAGYRLGRVVNTNSPFSIIEALPR